MNTSASILYCMRPEAERIGLAIVEKNDREDCKTFSEIDKINFVFHYLKPQIFPDL